MICSQRSKALEIYNWNKICAEYGDMSSSQYKKGQKKIIDQAKEDRRV